MPVAEMVVLPRALSPGDPVEQNNGQKELATVHISLGSDCIIIEKARGSCFSVL